MTTEPQAASSEIRRPEAMRWLVLAALVGVAVLCGVVAAASIERSPATMALTTVTALAVLLVARRLLLDKATRIIFDGARLADDTGAEICRLDEIEKVERGFALFKPSSGFVLVLKAPRGRGWAPGLWWRAGRRVGVGGATSSRAGRDMADAITAALAMRSAV